MGSIFPFASPTDRGHTSEAEGPLVTSPDHELLTPEEFAKRLRIGRSTVFDWMAKGVLLPGRHFVRIGKTVRFPWPQAFEALMADSAPSEVSGDSPTTTAPAPVRLSPQRRPTAAGGKHGPAVNLDY